MTCAATLDDIERVMAGDRQDRKLDGEESQLVKSVGKFTDVAMHKDTSRIRHESSGHTVHAKLTDKRCNI